MAMATPVTTGGRGWPASPSTAGRAWPMPDLRNGTTVHLVTDIHFGKRSFVDDWANKQAADCERFKVSAAGHVQAGDAIDWFNHPDVPEDAQYVSWRDGIKALDALPWAECVGNHDLSAHTVGDVRVRTTAQWAAAVGVPSQNTVTSMGAVKVITVGPDAWGFNGVGGPENSILSPATLAWLDAQLTANAGTPCWIAAHAPLIEQYPTWSSGWSQAPAPELDALIGSHPNVIGWLSGHLHADIQTNPEHATVLTVGGRRIFAVNGPATGGRISSVDFNGHQWLSPSQSMYVTYLGDAIDVRWRDHNAVAWTQAAGDSMRHILLAG